MTAAPASTPSDPSPPTARQRQPAMGFIMAVVLIDMMAVGLIVPVLPAIVGQFAKDPAEQSTWYGVLSTVYALATFFGAPVLGAMSDRYGRRPILLIGFCGVALNFFATALATSMWMLVASRVVGGAMQANAAVANAYVADITEPEQRARRFGMLGAMFGIGFILGPVVGGILGGIDLRLPFFVAGTLALVNLVYGIVVLPESLPPERRRAMHWKQINPLASLRQLAELRGVGLLVAVLACCGLAQFTMYTVWVLHNTFKFGWGPTENGWSLFAVGIVSAVVQGGLLGRLLKVTTPQKLAVWGLVSSTLAFALWGASTQPWMMYAIIFANLLGATVAATMQSLISSAADGTRQGQTMGAVSSLNSLTAVLAPVVASPLLAAVSHHPQGDWRIGMPFFFGALLQGLALLLAVIHFRKARRAELAAAPI